MRGFDTAINVAIQAPDHTSNSCAAVQKTKAPVHHVTALHARLLHYSPRCQEDK